MRAIKPEQLEQLYTTLESRRLFTLGLPTFASRTGSPLTLLTPEGVSMLVSQGIRVIVEAGLGKDINYDDARYSRMGAEIGTRTEALMANVVLYDGTIDVDDAKIIKPHTLLLVLTRNRPQNVSAARILLEKQVTVLALDMVQDHRGRCPLADILEEVSGRAAISIASAFMANPRRGKGILLGGVAGVNPCEVVILGTGMAALAAARSAIGLGGMVRLFDSDPYCLRTAISELGPAVIGSSLHPTVLGHAFAAADVIIATRLRHRFAIDDSVYDTMKKGVLIFDLDDVNGFSETFRTLTCMDTVRAIQQPEIVPSSSVCFTNPISCVPRTASMALTNDIVPIISRIYGGGHGLMNVLKTDAGLRNSVVFFRGRIVSREMAAKLNARYVDINLILSFS